MREPTWSDLVRLPERQAVELFFDARNDRYLRPALLVAGVAAAVGLIASLAHREGLIAVPWAALLLGVVAIFVLRRTGVFDRRPRAYLLGFVTALIAAVVLGLPEPAAGYSLAGFFIPLALVLVRLRPGQHLALGALCLVAAAWASTLIDIPDPPPPTVMPAAALLWIAASAAVSLRFSRRLRRHFLGEWRHHAALAREHSRMRSELDDARAVQLSMLPRAAPELPWVELASTTMPATEVGGDYFGYFPLDDQRLAIAIADVAGHGMASGLVLSGLRGGLHLLRDDMARPVEVLGRLDRMLRETSPGRMFVTLQIALLDAGRGELAVANAGHPPLLLLPAGGGEAVTIGAPGPPLGTRLAPGYVEVRHRLGAGDTVVLYTDGVAELRGPAGTALGEDGLLAEAARGARAPTAREVRDVLVGALARFKGDVEPADDLTMVIARITAAAVPDEDAIDSEEPLEPTGDPAALNPGSAATAGREER